MAVILGLLAALCYGASDFLGGQATKRAGVWSVAAGVQTVALLGVLAATPALGGTLTPSVWGWGALAGVGSGLGTLALYRGLAAARMNVVAPLSGVLAAALPVVVGLLTGDRPSPVALGGVLLALAAIVLVSLSRPTDEPGRSSGVAEGVVAGLAFGVLFVGLQRPGRAAGVWPLVVDDAVATGLLLAAALVVGRSVRLPRRTLPGVGLSGVLAGGATLLYLQATGHGLLSIVSVLVSLYPALTVILAAVVLRERSTRLQLVGMAGAAVAVALITLN